jgi:hypothetical protein
MSVRTMARVWADSQHGGTALLMLLAIADFSDDDGRAYPSIATLARKCRTKPRYALVLIDALRKSGELEVHKNKGVMGRGGRTNLYRVVFEKLTQRMPEVLNQGALLNQGAGSSEPGCREVVNQGAPNPSLNHQEPPVGAKPRKGGRLKSEKKTFKAWYEETKAANPEILSPDDPIHQYLEKLGLGWDFFLVHWRVFKAKHLESKRLQADWPQALRNSVKGNYGRLWYRTNEGRWKLTTAGTQAALEHDCDENMTSGGRNQFADCI